jgi:hypothetical protein
MFVVTEEDEAAIRAVYEQRGEFAAAINPRSSTRSPRARAAVIWSNTVTMSSASSCRRCGLLAAISAMSSALVTVRLRG